MKVRTKLICTGIIVVVLGLVAVLVNTASSQEQQVDQQQIPGIIAPRAQLVYSAKFVCGNQADMKLSSPVVPADYRTAINVHNPNNVEVKFTKKVVLAGREDESLNEPSKEIPFVLKPDYAFEIDCEDIYNIGNFDPATPFAKGFVVITTRMQLDLVGVYTSISESKDITLDLETITPKLVRR